MKIATQSDWRDLVTAVKKYLEDNDVSVKRGKIAQLLARSFAFGSENVLLTQLPVAQEADGVARALLRGLSDLVGPEALAAREIDHRALHGLMSSFDKRLPEAMFTLTSGDASPRLNFRVMPHLHRRDRYLELDRATGRPCPVALLIRHEGAMFFGINRHGAVSDDSVRVFPVDCRISGAFINHCAGDPAFLSLAEAVFTAWQASEKDMAALAMAERRLQVWLDRELSEPTMEYEGDEVAKLHDFMLAAEIVDPPEGGVYASASLEDLLEDHDTIEDAAFCLRKSVEEDGYVILGGIVDEIMKRAAREKVDPFTLLRAVDQEA